MCIRDSTQGERTPSCARPADVGARSPECAIRYEDVSFSYKAGTLFMEGLSAAIPAGAVTSIVGPNGCGDVYKSQGRISCSDVRIRR